jgi:hypothetical protein
MYLFARLLLFVERSFFIIMIQKDFLMKLLLVLLFVLSSCSSHRALEKSLNVASAETILEATLYELQNDVIGVELAKRLKTNDITEVFESQEDFKVGDFYKLLDREITEKYKLSYDEHTALAKSINAAKLYLGLPEGLMIKPVKLKSSVLPSDATQIIGWSPEVQKTDTAKVNWNGVDGYVKSRLGPMIVALGVLTSKDTLLISNLTIEEILIRHPEIEKIELLTLPISSYEKKIYWITTNSGNHILVVAEIKGDVLLKHFQMMMKRELESQNLYPDIIVEESKTRNEKLYSSLAKFWTDQGRKLSNVKSVVFGYASRYQTKWKKYFKGTVGDSVKDWGVDLYQFPSKQQVAVLQTYYPMHGEILAKSFGRLLKAVPEIRYFFSAGSAGSLILGPPNRMTYPGILVSEKGHSVINVLSPAYHKILHRSVDSPLEESPAFLRGLVKRNFGSVDMEFGHLSEEIPANAQVGIGITVTDFPYHSHMTPEVSLTSKNTAALKKAIDQYINSVFNFLEFGKKARISKAETLLDAQFDDVSKKNLLALEKSLGQLSTEEKKLFHRIKTDMVPEFYIRVTEDRAQRILNDGVFLSSGTVASIKNAPVYPTTPPVEDQMYGAYNQVFGGIGFNTGRERYGSVIFKVRPDAWKSKSWGSEYSAFRVYDQELKKLGRKAGYKDTIQDEAELKKIRHAFSKIIFTADEYLDAIALRTLIDLRALSKEVSGRFYDSKYRADLIQLMNEYDLGYIEGKIEFSLNLEDIEEVRVPKTSAQLLLDLCKAQEDKCEQY